MCISRLGLSGAASRIRSPIRRVARHRWSTGHASTAGTVSGPSECSAGRKQDAHDAIQRPQRASQLACLRAGPNVRTHPRRTDKCMSAVLYRERSPGPMTTGSNSLFPPTAAARRRCVLFPADQVTGVRRAHRTLARPAPHHCQPTQARRYRQSRTRTQPFRTRPSRVKLVEITSLNRVLAPYTPNSRR